MSNGDKSKLSIIDIESMSTPIDAIITEVKDIGKLEIVSYKHGAFRADGTGQKGNVSYQIQGKGKVYNLGANGVVKVSMGTGFQPMIADDKLGAFVVSEHFSKLRQARRHQLTLIAKKKV